MNPHNSEPQTEPSIGDQNHESPKNVTLTEASKDKQDASPSWNLEQTKSTSEPDELKEESKVSSFTEENQGINQIRDVWIDNFYEELATISSLIETKEYTIVSFDTEFPGIVHEGRSWVNGQLKYRPHYEWITKNVNELKLIQIGITIADDKGRMPSPISTWQFNMNFDLSVDHHSPDSIEILRRAGLNFEKHATRGISHSLFVECLLQSELVSNSALTWVAFNSAFDFAYMVRLLDSNYLPASKYEFVKKCSLYFPNFYDVKQLEISTGSLAEQVHKSDIQWIGNSHQAGSDSLVTMKLFASARDLRSFEKNVIYKFESHYSDSDQEQQQSFYVSRRSPKKFGSGWKRQNPRTQGTNQLYWESRHGLRKPAGPPKNYSLANQIAKEFIKITTEQRYSEEELNRYPVFQQVSSGSSAGDDYSSSQMHEQYYEEDSYWTQQPPQFSQQAQDPLTNIDMVHPNFISKHYSADSETHHQHHQQVNPFDQIAPRSSPGKVAMSTNAREFMPNRKLSADDEFKTRFEHQYKQKGSDPYRERPRRREDGKLSQSEQQSYLSNFLTNNMENLSENDYEKLRNIMRVHKINGNQ